MSLALMVGLTASAVFVLVGIAGFLIDRNAEQHEPSDHRPER